MNKYAKDIFDPKLVQYMLDLETLSLKPNACIVSIGCAQFSIEKGIIDTFSMNIDPFDAKQYGLDIDKDTIKWWQGQPTEISDMWKVNPQPLKDALVEFGLWFGGRSAPIYGNAASFDCVVLNSAFKAAGIPTPWNFRDEVCYRTICKMIDVPFDKDEEGLHCAVNDAVNQTKHLLKILRGMQPE